MVKFAHLADVHIGCWRDPAMRELSMLSFETALDDILGLKPDFVLISGDLFHSALPGVEFVKRSITRLKKLKVAGIRTYVIAGSHDFSPSGKTMLDVLEEADLLVNVFRGRVVEGALHLQFTKDEETGVLLAGVLGKAGQLERSYYEALGNREELESAEGFKIFLFHTALEELKPKHLERMPADPISFLPANFDYYAGGHVHIVEEKSLPGYKNVVYPGPLFPASFSELEKLRNGSYYWFDDGKLEKKNVVLKNVVRVNINVSGKTSSQVEAELSDVKDVKDAIVLLRLQGRLKEGKPGDVNARQFMKDWYAKGAFFVMKNSIKLVGEEYEEVKVTSSTAEEVEDALIKEHVGQVKISTHDESALIKGLINTLSADQGEGEKKYSYIERVIKDAKVLLER